MNDGFIDDEAKDSSIQNALSNSLELQRIDDTHVRAASVVNGKYVDHYCKFIPLRKTIARKVNGYRWIERCKCGRLVVSDCSFDNAESTAPTIRRSWFDRYGNLSRNTGAELMKDNARKSQIMKDNTGMTGENDTSELRNIFKRSNE